MSGVLRGNDHRYAQRPLHAHGEPTALDPFTEETARQAIQLAEDARNSKDPDRVSMAYTTHSAWRNRAEFINGRAEIVAFLKHKWAKELDYRLKKQYWAHSGNRIAVRCVHEWHDPSGQRYRSHGNENWEFDAQGLMWKRFASINDQPITEEERTLR